MSKVLENIFREVEALPEEEQQRIVRVLEEEVQKVKSEAPAPSGRWARFAERMHREAPMQGKSEAFLKKVREFRDNFDMRIKSAD